MPSAPEAVQAVARYVAPPVAQEGAAQMIERIALDGWRPPARKSPGVATGGGGAPRSAFRKDGVEVERR
jgi:hypothetical protein